MINCGGNGGQIPVIAGQPRNNDDGGDFMIGAPNDDVPNDENEDGGGLSEGEAEDEEFHDANDLLQLPVSKPVSKMGLSCFNSLCNCQANSCKLICRIGMTMKICWKTMTMLLMLSMLKVFKNLGRREQSTTSRNTS